MARPNAHEALPAAAKFTVTIRSSGRRSGADRVRAAAGTDRVPRMIRKLVFVFVFVVAAAAAFALWRFGLIDKRRVAEGATELQNRTERQTKEATKAAREAVESHRP